MLAHLKRRTTIKDTTHGFKIYLLYLAWGIHLKKKQLIVKSGESEEVILDTKNVI